MLARTWLARIGAIVLLVSGDALADSMLVPAVELREEVSGRYVLEAELEPAIAFRIGAPSPPERCRVDEPERTDTDEAVLLRFAIDCGADPLDHRDVLVLPWLVDGIQLSARWLDGTSRRALFGREQVGVVVRLERIRERQESFIELVETNGRAGWTHFWTSGAHIVFFLALALLGRVAWVALGGLASGHALALVLADVGVSGLPLDPADAVLAGAAALLMAAAIQDGVTGRDLFTLAAVVGTLHGLGVASESESVTSLFLVNLAGDVSGALVLTAAAAARSVIDVRRDRLVWVVGSAAVFFGLTAMRQALAPFAHVSASASGFMEVDTLTAPVSAAVLAPPPSQLDEQGQLASPFMSYLIVEPYQIRHEVLVDVELARAWIDVPLDSASQIPVDAQPAVTDTLAELVPMRAHLSIEDEPGRLLSARAEFVSLGPAGASTRETAIPEPLVSAIVGVTLVYETESIPDELELDWELFSEDVSAVPLTMTDPVAMVETELTPGAPRFAWRNTLGDYELPAIDAIRATKPRIPLVSIALCVVAFGAFVLRRRSAAIALLVVAYVVYPFARVEASLPIGGGPSIDRSEAADVVEGLLTNVYRCFDIADEDLIYDRLELTVTGDELVDIYLESRRALELEDRGGARVRIDDVVVREVRSIRAAEGGGFAIDALWTVGGSVNHFGHIHFRQNQYDATVTIVPVDGTWKIRALELVEERRVL